MSYKTTHAGLGLVLTLVTTTINAETWQLGILAENSRSPFIGDRRETNNLPLVNYIGDRFSYIGGKVQYELSSGRGSDTYLVAQMRPRQYYSASLDFDEDPGIEGMKDRHPAFELGLGFKNQTAWGQYVLEGLFDVTGAHQGFELTAKYSYPKQTGSWSIEPAAGLQLQSSDLVDYYHGVSDAEAQTDRPAYQGDQAINTLVSLSVAYTINARLLAIAGMEQIALDTSISDSPIVDEKQVRKVYLGLIYTF
jgi:outer membrane protein